MPAQVHKYIPQWFDHGPIVGTALISLVGIKTERWVKFYALLQLISHVVRFAA